MSEPGPADDVREASDKLRLALMEMSDSLLRPMHEWIAGEVTYYLGQGFTVEQAHAMTAAEYTTMLGNRIENAANRPTDPGADPVL